MRFRNVNTLDIKLENFLFAGKIPHLCHSGCCENGKRIDG